MFEYLILGLHSAPLIPNGTAFGAETGLNLTPLAPKDQLQAPKVYMHILEHGPQNRAVHRFV